MPLRAHPPSLPGDAVSLRGREVDLRTRVIVASVVLPPRFGREAEVVATARAAAATRADLVDVSLEPRLLGAAARAIGTPIATRVGSVEGATAAARAGASLVLIPPDLAAARTPLDVPGAAVAVVVADVRLVAEARRVALAAGVPLAFDSTALPGLDALAAEAVAVTDGCRILRSADVRRSRRIAETLGAVLAAHRERADTDRHTDTVPDDERGEPWTT